MSCPEDGRLQHLGHTRSGMASASSTFWKHVAPTSIPLELASSSVVGTHLLLDLRAAPVLIPPDTLEILGRRFMLQLQRGGTRAAVSHSPRSPKPHINRCEVPVCNATLIIEKPTKHSKKTSPRYPYSARELLAVIRHLATRSSTWRVCFLVFRF